MSQIELEIEEYRIGTFAGYHFRVVDAASPEEEPLYYSAEHLEELGLGAEGYPNPHLARAVAQVVRNRLSEEKRQENRLSA